MLVTKSYQDEIGNEREYELIFILRPDATKDEIKTISKRIMDIVTKKSGQVISMENWGRRNLAYEIQKNRKGIYLYFRILGLFDMISEVERLLRMIEKVIRYQTIKIDANVDPSARPSELTDAMIEAASDINASVPKKEVKEEIKEVKEEPQTKEVTEEVKDKVETPEKSKDEE